MSESTEKVTIKAPNLQTAEFRIRGTAPLVQNRFANKAGMMATQKAGKSAGSKRNRAPKDFEAAFIGATHFLEDGTFGFPAPAIRSALIDACRLVDFKMTLAKLSVFALADGLDREDGTPLIRIDAPAPEQHTASVRVGMGKPDIRIRPMWRKWEATVRIKFDADQFTLADVTNLLHRAGAQVGIGEGRPSSKMSHGQGWGTFEIVNEETK